MLPYILHILNNAGAPQDIRSICRKLRQFNITDQETDEELETFTKEALEKAMRMALVRKINETNAYTLTNKWFVPESQSFQQQLYEVVQNMPQALNGSVDSSSEEFAAAVEQPSDCMGPGMGQRRSPAQARAIAIYRRMREQREREEREAAAAARARKRRNSRSRSRSRTRRSSSSRARSRSKRRRSSTRSRSRSTTRARRTSRSRQR